MDNLEGAKEWFRLAEMDLVSAEYLTKMYPAPLEVICYHCQQSAEKYLKGYLVFRGIIPPKTHDLSQLQKMCLKFSEVFEEIADECSDLTSYGIQPRYPMHILLEERDMHEALMNARKIKEIVVNMFP